MICKSLNLAVWAPQKSKFLFVRLNRLIKALTRGTPLVTLHKGGVSPAIVQLDFRYTKM